jgi:T-complex protein 1 subunit delta
MENTGLVATIGSREHLGEAREKEKDVRSSNFAAARAVADAVRTSLGPKGMDKMIVNSTGEVVISNDGATILKQMEVMHPAARMLVELSKAQDAEAGDGTTSVVVLAGALLAAAEGLLRKGLHPTQVAESFLACAQRAREILKSIALPLQLTDRASLIKAASTALNSKVVSQYSSLLAPLAVDAVLAVIDVKTANNVDLRDIRVHKRQGSSMEETQLVPGLIFSQKVAHAAGGPTRVAGAKIGLIQFCLSAPKSNLENSVVVSDYNQIDRILKEERAFLLKQCARIQKTGCNVLLIQKSILRDSVSDLSLQLLAKMKIMVITDVERDDIDFISRTLACAPIASIDGFTAEKLGRAELVEEVSSGEAKLVKVTGVPNPGRTVSILLRGPGRQQLEEAERSLHDALCVVRSLVKQRFLLPGGGLPEIQLSLQLHAHAMSLPSAAALATRAYAEALEVIPYTLAENAGLSPIGIVTELRGRHTAGDKSAGINVRKGAISNILEENVVQPLLVSTSAITLATETVAMILKIDDMITTR